MYIVLWILLTFFVFWFVVLSHELGHFIFARLFWVKVEEFWIWIPPRLKRIFVDKKGTEYSLNWLPLWGYVNMKWEKPKPGENDTDSLMSKPVIWQMIIVLAWIFFNLILAFVLLTSLFYFWVQPLAVNTKFDVSSKTKLIPDLTSAIKTWMVKVDWIELSPIKWSVAEKAGLKEWDVLRKINGKEVLTPEQMIYSVKYLWPKQSFEISRSWSVMIYYITPKDWKIGCYVWYNIIWIDSNFSYRYSLPDAIIVWYEETLAQTKLTFELLQTLARKIFAPQTWYERSEAIESLWWPVALWELFVNMVKAQVGVKAILAFAALLSINLAAFNFLPLPALDGWRFFIMLINSIVALIFWRKAINENTESLVHIIWFVLLIAISIYIAYNDIFKLFS